VRHLTDGALRRLYDEPYALDEETRVHYHGCADCQARFATIADDARRALALMAVPGVTVDAATALGRVRARTGSGSSRPRLAAPLLGWRRPIVGGLVAAAVAFGLIGSLAFTPLASTLVKVFQPSQVTPVTVTEGDFSGLDAFAKWGDLKSSSHAQLQEAETAAEAAKISGLPLIRIDSSKLPDALQKAPVSYAAATRATGTVTFNGNAPAKLRGSTLTLTVGPAETAIYGDLGKLAQSARANAPSAAEPAKQEQAGGSQTGPEVDRTRQALSTAGPILAVAEMRAPEVTSTGVSVIDIKNALLAQPGLTPTMRAAISSFDDPKGNLPIPIPAGYVNSHSVQVQGVTGTAFGDNTGLGSAVIWIKNGRVYGVAGTVTEDQVLAVANSLR